MCNREAASVEAASAQWAGKAAFVGVAWTGDDDMFQDFVDRHGITFPTISDDDANVFTRFEVPSQPAMVIISANGDVQQFFGAVDEGLLDSVLTDVTGG